MVLQEAVALARESDGIYVDRDMIGLLAYWKEGLVQGDQVGEHVGVGVHVGASGFVTGFVF